MFKSLQKLHHFLQKKTFKMGKLLNQNMSMLTDIYSLKKLFSSLTEFKLKCNGILFQWVGKTLLLVSIHLWVITSAATDEI